ncbi:Protein EPIDERMAL PATTERNING FACTOR 1 [Acorus gramineus]|uniref:Epidermal patterning factor-like protein n=1 Tax=Acorus gramineus TaxID=55184 RepID=A0AAV9A7V9_ACOGR|nr:Protein EPIDERMAL PATTERNING FACTOR 1 [Acorus gramineus]
MRQQKNAAGPKTLQVAGSRLPDCSHACGSCSPCRLVMVSFVCASLEEAETCPMAYKCMCHSKSYPVP